MECELVLKFGAVNLLLKTNVGRDRKSDVVNLECFYCQREGG